MGMVTPEIQELIEQLQRKTLLDTPQDNAALRYSRKPGWVLWEYNNCRWENPRVFKTAEEAAWEWLRQRFRS